MPSANGHGPQRAVLYARVSGDEQAKKGYSLPDQADALRKWAEREGYEVLEEVADEGWSGAYLERPGLDRVRDLVQEGDVSVVAVLFRDRLARGSLWVDISTGEVVRHVYRSNIHWTGSCGNPPADTESLCCNCEWWLSCQTTCCIEGYLTRRTGEDSIER